MARKRPHDLNASSSSTTLNHPSSSHPLDDIVDVNDEESFHSNSSSPSSKILKENTVVTLVEEQMSRGKDWKLLFFDVAATFDSAVHRVHAVSFDAAVASPVSAACIDAAAYFVSAACIDAAAYFVSAAPQSSCFEKIYLETWN
ncbi:hypothetical protein Tco_0384841 [Tanacetum coccineum]